MSAKKFLERKYTFRAESAPTVNKYLAVIDDWIRDMQDNKDIDPDEELDWFALAYGWLMGKGLPQEDAEKLAAIMTYEMHIV